MRSVREVGLTKEDFDVLRYLSGVLNSGRGSPASRGIHTSSPVPTSFLHCDSRVPRVPIAIPIYFKNTEKISRFTYNVSYSIRANKGVSPKQRLTCAELWQDMKHGARHPGDYAAHVQSCTVLPGGTQNEFVRETVIGDGGIHTKKGKSMIQDVFLQANLYLLATVRETGHKTTMMVGYGCDSSSQEEEEFNPYLTLFYELVVPEESPPIPGSKEESDLVAGYRGLAKNLCQETVRLIRQWKENGTLQGLAELESAESTVNVTS
ncbi:hypothetical protein DL770_008531 [Monosporascus sp. CRB-9-2]|nr:hypothetical protein DL770_008531 [Monosporascus sp. CRB-9-2]